MRCRSKGTMFHANIFPAIFVRVCSTLFLEKEALKVTKAIATFVGRLALIFFLLRSQKQVRAALKVPTSYVLHQFFYFC